MPDISTELEALIRDFTARVVIAAYVHAGERVLAVVAAAITGTQTTPKASIADSENLNPSGTTSAPRKRKLSAKGLAVRKLQGKYLGVLRALKLRARARVKKVAREKGVAEAIKFAGSLK